MAETKLLFSYNIIINELSSVPLLHGVLFLHWTVGRTEGLWALVFVRGGLPFCLLTSHKGFSPHFAIKDHEIRFGMSFHLEQLIGVDRISNVLEDVVLKGESTRRVWRAGCAELSFCSARFLSLFPARPERVPRRSA
jgi:hypothetical protein